MIYLGVYGCFDLHPELFYKLDPIYFIKGSEGDTVIMCANEQEKKHLIDIGALEEQELYCDYFKLTLNEDY